MRKLDFLSQFEFAFRYARAAENEVAGALSRSESNSLQLPPGIGYTEIAAEQQRVGITSQGVPNPATVPFGDNT